MDFLLIAMFWACLLFFAHPLLLKKLTILLGSINQFTFFGLGILGRARGQDPNVCNLVFLY